MLPSLSHRGLVVMCRDKRREDRQPTLAGKLTDYLEDQKRKNPLKAGLLAVFATLRALHFISRFLPNCKGQPFDF